jgi:hypothetical protein
MRERTTRWMTCVRRRSWRAGYFIRQDDVETEGRRSISHCGDHESGWQLSDIDCSQSEVVEGTEPTDRTARSRLWTCPSQPCEPVVSQS